MLSQKRMDKSWNLRLWDKFIVIWFLEASEPLTLQHSIDTACLVSNTTVHPRVGIEPIKQNIPFREMDAP